MKAFAASLLLASLADASPCLCIFDVDATLISWALDAGKKCPKDQKHHLSDAKNTSDQKHHGYDMLRADAMLHLSATFCSNCYVGVISAGDAGGEGSEERADLTKYLKQGGKLPTDKWNPRSPTRVQDGCTNISSPLITDCGFKPAAVPGILKWYKDSQAVTIADKDVYFFDDKAFNIVGFEGHPYNARQISCPTDGSSGHTDDGKCGAEVAEITKFSGISYCCSGSPSPAPSPASKCTTGCGVPCHFPFTYNGRSYSECYWGDGDAAPWCATNSEYDGKNYGYCYGCSSDVRANLTTSDVIV